MYVLVAVTLSGILKAKQKLGVTFNSDKQDVIDLKKIKLDHVQCLWLKYPTFEGDVFIYSWQN